MPSDPSHEAPASPSAEEVRAALQELLRLIARRVVRQLASLSAESPRTPKADPGQEHGT